MNDQWNLPPCPTRQQANERVKVCHMCFSFLDDAEDVVVLGARFYAYACTNCGRTTLIEVEGRALDENGDAVKELAGSALEED